MSYCSSCGYKIEGDFKFCPNCGSKINATADEFAKDVKADEKIVCKNCGEENPIENVNCFSCGVPLKSIRSKKETSNNKKRKESYQKKTDREVQSQNVNLQSEEKVLDTKKIIFISSIVLVIFIAALLISGVFDSGVQTNNVQTIDSSSSNVASLENLNEITELENKIQANPDDMESTLHLAHLQQDSKLFDKAIVNYKKYLIKNPKDADARVDMGICYYNLGDYKSAIDEMETALKYQPKHQIACLNLGIVNLTAKNLEASKEWFKKAVELDPSSEAGKRAQELLKSH
jgi:tetratricopeptide (TPR) repeat protein/predicted RNA-binding Zn-ribbon protein involved in translation (DUF1610 family)